MHIWTRRHILTKIIGENSSVMSGPKSYFSAIPEHVFSCVWTAWLGMWKFCSYVPWNIAFICGKGIHFTLLTPGHAFWLANIIYGRRLFFWPGFSNSYSFRSWCHHVLDRLCKYKLGNVISLCTKYYIKWMWCKFSVYDINEFRAWPRNGNFPKCSIKYGNNGTVQAWPNGSNIIQHCWTCCTVLNEVAKQMQHAEFNTSNEEVWVQNLPKILRKQTHAIFVCTNDGARSILSKEMFSCYCFAWNVGRGGW